MTDTLCTGVSLSTGNRCENLLASCPHLPGRSTKVAPHTRFITGAASALPALPGLSPAARVTPREALALDDLVGRLVDAMGARAEREVRSLLDEEDHAYTTLTVLLSPDLYDVLDPTSTKRDFEVETLAPGAHGGADIVIEVAVETESAEHSYSDSESYYLPEVSVLSWIQSEIEEVDRLAEEAAEDDVEGFGDFSEYDE